MVSTGIKLWIRYRSGTKQEIIWFWWELRGEGYGGTRAGKASLERQWITLSAGSEWWRGAGGWLRRERTSQLAGTAVRRHGIPKLPGISKKQNCGHGEYNMGRDRGKQRPHHRGPSIEVKNLAFFLEANRLTSNHFSHSSLRLFKRFIYF